MKGRSWIVFLVTLAFIAALVCGWLADMSHHNGLAVAFGCISGFCAFLGLMMTSDIP